MRNIILRLVRLTALVEEPAVGGNDRLVKTVLGRIRHICPAEYLGDCLILQEESTNRVLELRRRVERRTLDMNSILVLVLIGLRCGFHHIVEDEVLFQVLYTCEIDHCGNVHCNEGLNLVVVEVANERSTLRLPVAEIQIYKNMGMFLVAFNEGKCTRGRTVNIIVNKLEKVVIFSILYIVFAHIGARHTKKTIDISIGTAFLKKLF